MTTPTPEGPQLVDGPQFVGARIVHPDEQLVARRFVLRRRVDVSGISGTGDVADGVLWPDGTASVRWRGPHPSVVFWDRGRVSVEFVHGHQGATEVEFVDGEDGQPAPTGPAVAPLPLYRAVEIALGKPVACPKCGRKVACRCANAPRTGGRVETVLAAVRPWLRPEAGGKAS